MGSLPAVECNKENMRTWVAGLRSGERTQGTGYLAVQVLGGDGEKIWTHCRLGVACELATEAGVTVGVVEGVRVGTAHDELLYKKFSGEASYLPLSVSTWLGLSGSQKDNPWVAVNLTATQANDGKKWSYDQIADAIETFYGLNDESVPEVTDDTTTAG